MWLNCKYSIYCTKEYYLLKPRVCYVKDVNLKVSRFVTPSAYCGFTDGWFCSRQSVIIWYTVCIVLNYETGQQLIQYCE